MSYPHETLIAFTHGVSCKWNYLMRTVPGISTLLAPLEDALHRRLIPAITGRPPCSAQVRDLPALSAKVGGFGIAKPTVECAPAYEASRSVTASLSQLIKRGSVAEDEVHRAKSSIARNRNTRLTDQVDGLRGCLDLHQQSLLDFSQEKGASTWLTVLPIVRHGFDLHKSAFRDAMCLRYGWQLQSIPHTCSCRN